MRGSQPRRSIRRTQAEERCQMRYKLVFFTGLGIGFVLGAKAGRERYEQLQKAARKAWDSPAVQQAAGAPLLELFPMMPVMGNLTLVVAALSYAGQLNLTAAADRDACPDVAVFAEGARNCLDHLARSALVSPS